MEGQTPKPPRRPLTPYMRYSKSIWKSVKEGKDEIWQSVKEANPSLSVCEIGATIGKMWRELDDATKQKYNEDFIQDKARYDEELQAYLKLTGLQASDLAKPKSRKKADNKSRANHHHQAATPPPGQVINASPQQGSLGLSQMPPPGYPGQPMGMQLPNFPANSPQVSVAGALPHFSQIWTTGQFDGQPGQMMMLNAQGQPVQISNGQAISFFQPQLQAQLQQQAQQVQQASEQAQQQSAAQQTTEALTTYNGSPQMPAASASPHLNSNSPLAGDQQQYEQQQQQQQQQSAAAGGQFAQWALQQQVLEQQQQLAVQQSFQQESQAQPGSDGSEAKASPQSQLSETNSPAAPASAGVEAGEHNQSMTSHDGDSNSVGSSSATADTVTTQHQLPQYASAHNNFNSYANFPWNSFPQAAQNQIQADAQALAQNVPTTTAGAATDANGKPVFTKESILESELSHLRTALSEQTKEVQRLGQELEKAYSVIDQLKAERAQLQVHAQQQAQVNAQAQAQIQAQAQAAQAQAQAAQAQLEAQNQLNLGLQRSPPTPANSSPGATM